MKMAATSVGLLALAGTIVPPAVFMLQSIAAGQEGTPGLSLDTVKAIMLVSTIAWFAAAPFWMKVE
jgi:hypothetical protein